MLSLAAAKTIARPPATRSAAKARMSARSGPRIGSVRVATEATGTTTRPTPALPVTLTSTACSPSRISQSEAGVQAGISRDSPRVVGRRGSPRARVVRAAGGRSPR